VFNDPWGGQIEMCLREDNVLIEPREKNVMHGRFFRDERLGT
jgi:hypothetical protein